MNDQKIEELKESLRQVVQLIVQRDQPMPEDLKILLTQVMEHVASRIQELRSEGAIPAAPTAKSELEPGPYPSSNINAFKYDPDSEQLYIKFHGKDTADSGPLYKYSGVPSFIYDVFRRGAVGPKSSGSNKYHTWHKNIMPSLGAAAYALIKSGPFSYQKIS